MATFETIKSEEVKFGANNFIEIARKKFVGDDGENLFISISRGFVTQNGEKRYKKSFSVPINQEVINFISEKIKHI